MSSFIFQRTEPAFAAVKMQNAVGSDPDPASTHMPYLSLYQRRVSNVVVYFQRSEPAFAEVKMQNAAGRSHPDPVSTHILDTARGVPAADVAVVMFRMGGDLSWMKINSK